MPLSNCFLCFCIMSEPHQSLHPSVQVHYLNIPAVLHDYPRHPSALCLFTQEPLDKSKHLRFTVSEEEPEHVRPPSTSPLAALIFVSLLLGVSTDESLNQIIHRQIKSFYLPQCFRLFATQRSTFSSRCCSCLGEKYLQTLFVISRAHGN